MRILIASVTNAPVEILDIHLKSVTSQTLPKHVTVDYLYLADPELSEASLECLRTHLIAVLPTDPKPVEAEYTVSEETHHWNMPTFYWLGDQKQRLIDHAKDLNYDGIFFVDSDLVLDRGTLSSLLSTGKSVVSGVFWTKWTPKMPALPQVWMEHPYEMQGRGVEAHEHLSSAANRHLWKVAGLGACTFIKKQVLGQLGYGQVLGLPEEGMWQGEDRAFCVRAERAHIDLFADGWPSIYHIYRPSDIPGAIEFEKRLSEDHCKNIRFGDLVSLRLTPVEEGNLTGWSLPYRGRLGNGELLASLERALEGRCEGDDFFASVKFPIWWEVPEYRGVNKVIRIQVLGVKSPGLHPGREADEDFGVYYES